MNRTFDLPELDQQLQEANFFAAIGSQQRSLKSSMNRGPWFR